VNDFYKTIRKFLTEFLPQQKGCSPNTIQSYKTTLNLLIVFLQEKKHLKLTQVDFSVFSRQLLMEFLDWLEKERACSAVSRNQRLAALRSFFKYAGMLDCSLLELSMSASSIPLKRTAGKVVGFLSEAALETLLKQPNPAIRNGLRDQFFLVLMYDTAARCGELLHLKICDLRLNEKHAVIYLTGKGGKTRIVPLIPKTVEHCRRYLQYFHPNQSFKDQSYVFYGRDRKPLSADAVAAFMKKYGAMAQQSCVEMPTNLHPHMLRHTRAMHLYRSSMPLPLLADYLGHANAETTSIYAYADSEMKRAAMQKSEDLRKNHVPQPKAIWHDDEDMILKLSGLK
jgi:site-specific recombinase XerD